MDGSNKIVYVIDESASMENMGSEPIQALNCFIREQQALNIAGTTFTLVKFNSNVAVVYDNETLSTIEEFRDYRPFGMTALYDGIGRGIELAGEENENVVFVILTDGYENSSSRYTRSAIKSKIRHLREQKRWTFIYAAADQDAFETGGQLGIPSLNCQAFNSADVGAMLAINRSISADVTNVRNERNERNVRGASSTESKSEDIIEEWRSGEILDVTRLYR